MPTKWLLRSVALTVPSKFVVTATISVAFVFIPRQKISNASRSHYWLAPLGHSIRSIFPLTREIWQRNGPTDGTYTPKRRLKRYPWSPWYKTCDPQTELPVFTLAGMPGETACPRLWDGRRDL